MPQVQSRLSERAYFFDKPILGRFPAGIFLASLCLTFVCYQLSFRYSLSADSYGYLFGPRGTLVDHYSSGGRPLSALIQFFLDSVNLDVIATQKWTSLISVCLLAWATALLEERLLNLRRRSDWLFVISSLICSFLVVSNVFIAEWFSYSFITPMACLSQLLAVMGALILSRSAFEKRDAIYVVGLALASATLFQASFSLLVPLAVVLLCAQNVRLRILVQRVVLGTLAYVVSGMSSMLYVRFIHPLWSHTVDSRAGMPHLLGNARAIWSTQYPLWVESMNLMPRYVFAAIVLACIAVITTRSPHINRTAKYGIPLAIILVFGLSYGPHLASSFVWVVPRSITTVGSLPGLLLLGLLLLASKERDVMTAVLATACLMVTLTYSNQVLSDFVSSYREDQQEGKLLYDRILAHEHSTGLQVNNVAFSLESDPPWCYPGIRCVGDLNARAWARPWARLGILEVVSGRKFREVPFEPHTLTELFGVNHWGRFSLDKVHFIGDTAYIGIY